MAANRHWNHHRWHVTNSLERTRLSCWCLQNHKWCTYRAPVKYVTKTWSVVLLNKKIHILLSEVYCVWQVVKTQSVSLNNPVFTTTMFHVLNILKFIILIYFGVFGASCVEVIWTREKYFILFIPSIVLELICQPKIHLVNYNSVVIEL